MSIQVGKFLVEFEEGSNQISKLINTETAEDITPDNLHQEYCDFLSAAAFESRREDLRPVLTQFFGLLQSDNDVFFSDIQRLEDYCLEKHLTIYTGPPVPGIDIRMIPCDLQSTQWTESQHFINLTKAIIVKVESSDNGGGKWFARSSNIWVSSRLLEKINRRLLEDESILRKLSNWPVQRTFSYLDVSDFSRFSAGQQSLVIKQIIRMVKNDRFWGKEAPNKAREAKEAMICIGDGYIYVFRSAYYAVVFSAYLAHLIETRLSQGKLDVDFHFRMGIHTGPVYRFRDPEREKWNYTGDGINGGQRVLSAIKEADDILFVSAEVRNKFADDEDDLDLSKRVLSSFQNRGRREDKHKQSWRVYEVNHTLLAAAMLPQDLRVIED